MNNNQNNTNETSDNIDVSALVYTNIEYDINEEDLDNQDEYETIEQENWAPEVFGNMAYKIRPDVLRYIRINKDTVIKRLSEI